jgi:hypothetical protein
MTAANLARQLAADQKFRKQLHQASDHAARASQRMRSHFGLLAPFREMVADQQLRTELEQLTEELQAAWKRAEKKRHHRLRNSLLLVASAGAATVVILPRSRQWLRHQTEELRGTPENEHETPPQQTPQPTASVPPGEAVS